MAVPSTVFRVPKGIVFLVLLTALGWWGSWLNLGQSRKRALATGSSSSKGILRHNSNNHSDATTETSQQIAAGLSIRTSNNSNDTTMVAVLSNTTARSEPHRTVAIQNGHDYTYYQNEEEMLQRSERFPSVAERVQLYMGDWYVPPCGGDDTRIRYNMTLPGLMWIQELGNDGRRFVLDSKFNGTKTEGAFDQVHFLERHSMVESCSHRYCLDLIQYLFPALDAWNTSVPILFQFGDAERTVAPPVAPGAAGRAPRLPIWKKFRRVTTKQPALQDQSNTSTCTSSSTSKYDQPIVFKLKTQRHFGPVAKVDGFDVPWEDKIDRAVFRGALTGKHPTRHEGDTFVELCSSIPRCWFVYQSLHKNNSLVDAKLVRTRSSLLPEAEVSSVGLYGDSMSTEDMLKYKMIIMLEGNDVSSGLKWALFSNSVVLMPEPKYTSWALEELLVPWVHYVPLTLESPGNNASDGETALLDVEEKAAWVLSNDEHARKIAYNGKLWIKDLLFHKDACLLYTSPSPRDS